MPRWLQHRVRRPRKATRSEPPPSRETSCWIDDTIPSGAKPPGQRQSRPGSSWARPIIPCNRGEKSTVRTAEGAQPTLLHRRQAGFEDRRRRPTLRPRVSRPRKPAQGNHAPVQQRLVGASGILGRRRHRVGQGGHAPVGQPAEQPLPSRASGVRLEVEAAKVGLKPGSELNGWAFTAVRRHRALGTRRVWASLMPQRWTHV